jgi:hypothetical protein
MVWINDHHRIDRASVWRGTKNSGIGRENGSEGYLSCTEPKSVIVNASGEDFDWYDSSEDLRCSRAEGLYNRDSCPRAIPTNDIGPSSLRVSAALVEAAPQRCRKERSCCTDIKVGSCTWT